MELGQLRIENAQLRTQLTELQEFAKAEAEGRLVVLPVKMGDMVYVAQPRRISELCVDPLHKEIVTATITKITIGESGISYIRMLAADDRLADFTYKHFQETVFLTREEAEKALGGDTP